MQFFKVATLLAHVTTGLAAPQAEAQTLAKRGFGCPDDGPCNTHCLSIGRNGGYCSGFLWMVCTCNEMA